MDAEIKRKWVAALRSGKYRQGFNALSSTTREGQVLCCIGVGFCVAKPEENVCAHGTTDAAQKLGLTPAQEFALVGLNDDDEASFAAIADYIEQNL